MKITINKNRINVCFVCPKAYPLLDPSCPATFGGAEVDLYLLGRELAKDDGFGVHFITADYGQPAEQHIQNIHVIKSLNIHQNPLLGAWKLWRAMKKIDADIYFLESASLGVALAAFFCRHFQKAFVYRTASMLEANGQYIKSHFLIGKLFAWGLRNARVVLTQNQTDQTNLKASLNIDSILIPNGHPMSLIEETNKATVLWAGRSDGIKGPFRFLELASHFPDQQFVMICPPATGDTTYPNLQKRAAQIKNLEFLPRVDFHKIDSYFQQARILVNTSDSEGFANTFIQAGAARAAILSFAVNPDEFLTRYNCGVCCRGDMDKLKAGLAFLLDGNRYIEIGKNGRKYVEEKHDISTIVEQYKAIFVRLAEQKRRKQ